MNMNRKGFTLVEMIVVILLIGIIGVVAIPNVIRIINDQNREKYNAHLKLVKQALDLYTLRYKGDFDESMGTTTYKLPYKKLVDEKLLVEDGITCGENDYIVLTRKKGNSYSYEYYFTCKDDKGNEYTENKDSTFTCNESTNCITIE